MPRKKLSLEQGKKLLEDTKRRLRLEQEARKREWIEQIEFERFDRLGIRLFNEYWTLEGPTDSQSELLSDEGEDNNPQNPPLTQRQQKRAPLHTTPTKFTTSLP
jgi:hypothetical protein